jgi:DNA-binding transcriptional MerR regulator
MGQRTKVEGTKIAQAAKDLNVTSVTIRRYLAEFNIKTATDENGIKVLPRTAMVELSEIRRLKEEGLTNPKVLEILAEKRALRQPSEADDMEQEDQHIADIDQEQALSQPEPPLTRLADKTIEEGNGASETDNISATEEHAESGEIDSPDNSGPEKVKHSLTCQTCGKTFEHSNPRLRDCLDCYRTKRKERRRGGEKHKNVIQHPLAQQMANKTAQLENAQARSNGHAEENGAAPVFADHSNGKTSQSDRAADYRPGGSIAAYNGAVSAVQRGGTVRNYRKAIEETRTITGSLKRRLERPDLPEGERKWLEQIYAYQLILHQGWRHLSEYKSATVAQAKSEEI